MSNVWKIYAYEDCENKAVYVGLTKQELKRRHNGHLHKKKGDTPRDYFASINKPLPMPMERMELDTEEDAQYYEDWYINAYKENGWKVLNKAKTGVGVSSVGSDGGHEKKWTYETCFELASKCNTKSGFKKKNSQAYLTAIQNGWLKDYTWFEHPRKDMGFWTKDRVEEIGRKFRTKADFKRGCSAAYSTALKNGWMKDFDWFEKGGVKWTYNKCMAEARKYDSKKNFERGNKGAYEAAYKNGWLKDYDWFMSTHDAKIAGMKKYFSEHKREGCFI